jgi:hypothetical protein
MAKLRYGGSLGRDKYLFTPTSGAGSPIGPSTGSYVVQEEDGTSKLILEEGTFFLLTEEST